MNNASTKISVSFNHSPQLETAYLPESLFSSNTGATDKTALSNPSLGWELSPSPFTLPLALKPKLEALGYQLFQFLKAAESLYRESLKGNAPRWVSDMLALGKPEALLNFSQMKRFKNQFPRVIRPDLLLTETGWALCEIDSVPGGIGFTAALNEAYRKSGFSVIEAEDGMPHAFWRMLQAAHLEKTVPNTAILLSDEAGDYRTEMQWLVNFLKTEYQLPIELIHPKQITLVREQLMWMQENAAGISEVPIDLVYRFFELFDLPNIPKIELVQYALKKGWTGCTPPWKPILEEKMLLTFLHHPLLQSFWKKQLASDVLENLQTIVPPGWMMDPAPLPPAGIIPGLEFGGEAIQSFQALKGLSQKERQLVLKPSGFSPLAWGSRGVTIGHDVSGTVWDQTVQQALDSFSTSPYLLQHYRKPSVQFMQRLDTTKKEIKAFPARVRLCPYYFVTETGTDRGSEKVELAGILATACPTDKKIIHGMKDAILAPCQFGEN